MLSATLKSNKAESSLTATARYSEKLLIDTCEYLNAIYDDHSQINEILTIKHQSTMIEGCAFFHKGFLVINQLE
jgi:hypothetical protein